MSDAASPVVPPGANQPQLSAGKRLALAFTSPGAVFEDIVRKPTVLVVLIALVLVALGAQAVIVPKLDMETAMRAQFAKANVPEEKQDQIIHMAAMFKWVGVGMTPIAVPMQFALIAGLYFLALKLVGSESNDFVRIFSGIAHAWWPPGVVKALIVAAASFTHSTIDPTQAAHLVKSNVGSFLPADTSRVIVVLCDQLDIFDFWKLGLVILALKIVGRVSLREAALIGVFFYVATSVLIIIATALGQMAQGIH